MVVFESQHIMYGNLGLTGLTLTLVVFEYSYRSAIYGSYISLTLTLVVFEFRWNERIEIYLVSLTLTLVVFEFL